MPRCSCSCMFLTIASTLALAAGAATAQDRLSARMFEISGAPAERPAPTAWLMGGEPTLHDLVSTLREAASDTSTNIVILRIKDAQLTQTQVEELRAPITTLREAGKKVYLFGDALGTTDMLLGAATNGVIGQTGGPVSLPGMYMEEMFLADTLAWAGLKPDFVQVGDYKGASEAMARNAPSKEWSENIDSLLDSLYANLRGTLKDGYSLSDEQLDNAMKQLWFGDMDEAKQAGIVGSVIDLPQLSTHLRNQLGNPVVWGSALEPASEGQMNPMSMMGNPFAMLSMFERKPDMTPSGDAIAVIHIDGAIVDGDSTNGGFFGGEGSVGSRTIRNALEDIRKENGFKGVVVRINSPGGSATASEVIWQGLRRVAEKKPVWVSVGSMAASGGYYCAVAGDRIYVNPSSIVGSIGVVGGKISMGGLYEKLKVNVEGRGRGPMADMFASAEGWSESERAIVREKMTQTYDLFTRRVSDGRSGIELSKTAEGRLFTGNKAIELKMADEIGGLEDCLADLAGSLSLDEDYEVFHFPAPKSLADTLKEAFEGVEAPVPAVGGVSMVGATLRELLGEKAFRQVQPQLEGLVQLRDQPGKVLLMSPKALIFR